MLNRDLEITLNLAFKDARNKRHEFMTVEHLLLALLDNQAAIEVLNACGADLERLRRELTEFIDSTTPLIPKQDQERETHHLRTIPHQSALKASVKSWRPRQETRDLAFLPLEAGVRTLEPKVI